MKQKPAVTLETVNANILVVKQELDDLREFFADSQLELRKPIKVHIQRSRKRPPTAFKTQHQLERVFYDF